MAVTDVVTAQENESQAAAWNAAEGEHWATNWEFYDLAVRRHHSRLMTAAAIATGAHVLDLACGNGQATREAAGACEPGAALGVDLSAPMIERARSLAHGVSNASFVQGDAQIYPFQPAAFDVAISRFGAMFFGDPVAAFTNVRRALRAGGRLVMMSWRAPQDNEWITAVTAALTLGRPGPVPPAGVPGPFGHADRDRTTAHLEAAGFAAVEFAEVDAPVYLGRDADQGFGVLSVALRWMTEGLTDQQREDAVGRLRDALVAKETPEGVAFGSAAWLITAAA
jgi:SAM-dependent methyltransferase